MKKFKFTKNQLINIFILAIIYITWIISIHVVMQIADRQDNYIIYTNLVGSVIAFAYTILLHYPLIPLFSKYINARTENEAVALRRSYAIKVLYTIIIGFFCMAFIMFLELDTEKHILAYSWGLIRLAAGVVMATFAIFTLQHMRRMRVLMYVDKLQHKNADIEG